VPIKNNGFFHICSTAEDVGDIGDLSEDAKTHK
jgi:hypothetical protein